MATEGGERSRRLAHSKNPELFRKMRRTEHQYLDFDPFAGDRDVDIEFREISIVTTRTEHACLAAPTDRVGHKIPVGQRAWKEVGKVEGRVASVFCCFECLDQLMDECGLGEE